MRWEKALSTLSARKLRREEREEVSMGNVYLCCRIVCFAIAQYVVHKKSSKENLITAVKILERFSFKYDIHTIQCMFKSLTVIQYLQRQGQRL